MTDTLYKSTTYYLNGLVEKIRLGELALPELQRPFVWNNVRVRDLFDSMYRGYPVGFFLFWETGSGSKTRTIGEGIKQRTASQLFVDGQQRLTALYAVMTGWKVVRKGQDAEQIRIRFNPLKEKFEVANATTPNNPEFLPNISAIWDRDTDFDEVKEQYFDNLAEVRSLNPEEKKAARQALNRLEKLSSYPFSALEISSSVKVEQVSEIFVRVNSKGKKLEQSDFILTLMSVYWDEGRAALEAFSRQSVKPSTADTSPYNTLFQPGPDTLLRVAIAVAFRRSRLKYVYSILRGQDLRTGDISEARREENFDQLKKAQEKTLNLQYWHDFLKAIRGAGFKHGKLISSYYAVLFAYVLYLIGRTELGMEETRLRRLIGQFYFITSLTRRYTTSPESSIDSDLAILRGVADADAFEQALLSVCQGLATNDFWQINLPTELATSSPQSPAGYAFFASLCVLDAPVLYSDQTVSELMLEAAKSPRQAIERHHLFPKAFLATRGITDTRETNQIANYALVEWSDNVKMGKRSPADYVPEMETLFSADKLLSFSTAHALPDGWQNMDYFAFLKQRRELMADYIRQAYLKLASMSDGGSAPAPDIATLVHGGESKSVEFKSTLRRNLHTGENDPRIEKAALKTLVGFLNAQEGGTLFIGVDDEGHALGLDADGFASEDKLVLHLNNLIKERISAAHMLYISVEFETLDDKRIIAVHCQPSRSPAFLKDGQEQRFYVRTPSATLELKGQEMQAYKKDRFN